MLISAVIQVRNRFEHLVHLLRSIEQAAWPLHESIQIEVVVADFLSTDGDVRSLLARSTLTTKYVPCAEAFRRGRGRNRAFSRASGEMIAFIDADMLIPENYFQKALQIVSPGVAWFPICRDAMSGFSYKIPIARQWANRKLIGKRRPCGWGNFIVLREDLRKVGAWSETHKFWGKEDNEIAKRTAQRGIKVVRADLTCFVHQWHPRGKWLNKFCHKSEVVVRADSQHKNWGDIVSTWLYRRLTGYSPQTIRLKGSVPEKNIEIMMAGSIMHFATGRSVVWGSGFIKDGDKPKSKPRLVHAVRGPLTHARLHKLKIHCPEVYGDPGLLVPLFCAPDVKPKYELGIVPHYRDVQHPWIKTARRTPTVRVIDVCSGVEAVAKAILSCQMIASSSLHGLICADAYGIPAAWVKLSDKLVGGAFKFRDYSASVGQRTITPVTIESGSNMQRIREACEARASLDIETRQKDLMDSCPIGATS